jgi:hypothetical protein
MAKCKQTKIKTKRNAVLLFMIPPSNRNGLCQDFKTILAVSFQYRSDKVKLILFMGRMNDFHAIRDLSKICTVRGKLSNV